MDETITTIENTDIEEAVAEVPEEVQDFVWSSAFDILITGIQKSLGLPDEQKAVIKDGAEDLVLGIIDMETLKEKFLKSGMTEEGVMKVLFAIDQEVISRAENINDFYSGEEEAEEKQPPSPVTAPSPADVLASLKSRLVQPSAIAPSAREHTGNTSDIVKKEVETSPTSRIDPYRELPQ